MGLPFPPGSPLSFWAPEALQAFRDTLHKKQTHCSLLLFWELPPHSSSPLLLSCSPGPSFLSVLGTFLSYDPSRQTLACSAAQSTTSALTIASHKESHRKKTKKTLIVPICKSPPVRVLQQCLPGSQRTVTTHTNEEHQSSSIRIWPFCDVIKKTDKCPTHLLAPPTQTALLFVVFFSRKLKQVETGGCKQRANSRC